MIKEKMKLDNGIGYVAWNSQSYQLYILMEFLSTEMVGDGYNFFYNWMKDSNLMLTSGNVIGVKKMKDKVLMHLLFDSKLFYSNQKKYSLIIPLEQLISVSEQWHEVIKNKPPFIIITEDNGIYTVNASQE